MKILAAAVPVSVVVLSGVAVAAAFVVNLTAVVKYFVSVVAAAVFLLELNAFWLQPLFVLNAFVLMLR